MSTSAQVSQQASNSAENAGQAQQQQPNTAMMGAANAAVAAANGQQGPPQTGQGQRTVSLYVGDLDENVSESMLFDKFNTLGPIVSIRVCRDMISRKSLGYAYINYANLADAEKAIEDFNFDMMLNRKMRIMWSQRDPSLRRSGDGNLFIKNLDKNVTARELNDTFSLFGTILSSKIAYNEQGQSKGYGFVHFDNVESAENAINTLNNKVLKEKRLFVGPFIPRSARMAQLNGVGQPAFNNLFVKNFGEEMTEEQLKEIFAVHGEIVSLKVEMGENNKSKGFGFVCYKDFQSAQNAVQAENGREIGGRNIFVGKAMKKSERAEFLRHQFEKKKTERNQRYATGVNLYVKNLDDNIDDEQLRTEFGKFGTITSVKVMRDINGRSKGFGFVCFSFPAEATRAVTDMNGNLVGSKPLYVALAQRKEERRVHLNQQHAQRVANQRAAMPGATQAPMAGMNVGPGGHAGAQGMGMGQPHGFTMQQQQQQQFMQYQLMPSGAPNPNMFHNLQRQLLAGQNQQQAMNQMNAGFRGPMGQQRWPAPNHQVAAHFRQPQPHNFGMYGPQRPNQMFGGPQPRMMHQPPQGPPAQIRPGQASAVQYGQNVRNLAPQPPQAHPAVMAQHQQNVRAQQPPAAPLASLENPQPQAAGPEDAQAPAELAAPPQAGPVADFDVDEFVNRCRTLKDKEAVHQLLGEKLYQFISRWYPNLCGKLTGMLLELEYSEVIDLIVEATKKGSENSLLKGRVDAAYEVLLKQGTPPERPQGPPEAK